MRSFSLASVILSYFLVAGGLFAALLALAYMHVTSEAGGYLMLGCGAFAGGLIAARASRGSTIIEPAIGGLAVIGTVVALVATSDVGNMLWINAHDQTLRAIVLLAASSGVGALVGAWIGESQFGPATLSPAPWFIYTAFATFGACVIVSMIVGVLFATGRVCGEVKELGQVVLLGIAAGCLLAGLAVGASARSRPLLASLVGGAAGVAGFCFLLSRAATTDRDQLTGLIALSVAGGVVTLIGTLLGWIVVGRRLAGT